MKSANETENCDGQKLFETAGSLSSLKKVGEKVKETKGIQKLTLSVLKPMIKSDSFARMNCIDVSQSVCVSLRLRAAPVCLTAR